MIRLASQNSRIIAVALVAAVLMVTSLSVAGLLQSTERLGTSGIIIESAPVPPMPLASLPSPPPPEPKVEIDVYEDQACTSVLSSIVWGEIEAGESSRVTVYVKNNGDTNVLLGLDSQNWTPANSAEYTSLSWDYDDTPLAPGEVRGVTLTIDVDSDCPAMNNFGFDVIIIGS